MLKWRKRAMLKWRKRALKLKEIELWVPDWSFRCSECEDLSRDNADHTIGWSFYEPTCNYFREFVSPEHVTMEVNLECLTCAGKGIAPIPETEVCYA
jgi:hypothetical protein